MRFIIVNPLWSSIVRVARLGRLGSLDTNDPATELRRPMLRRLTAVLATTVLGVTLFAVDRSRVYEPEAGAAQAVSAASGTPSATANAAAPRDTASVTQPSVTQPSVTQPSATPLAATQLAAQPILGPGTWRVLTLAVADTGVRNRQVRVYTPAVPQPAMLPVVYALHGLPGSDADLCNSTASGGLDIAFRAGVEPFVLACPDASVTSVPDAEWADTADGSTHLETFVTDQVIRAVEGDHRRTRGMRALAGFSMGGFAAASLALRHPNLYGQVVALAGYFHLDDPDGAFSDDPDTHDPDQLLPAAGALRWYLAQARDDSMALTNHDAERWAAQLRNRNMEVTLTTTPGGHTVSWADAQLPAAASFLAKGWHGA